MRRSWNAAEHLILRSQRKSRQPRLDRAKNAQGVRKDEKEVHAENGETGFSEQSPWARAEMTLASRSKGIRLMTNRVPGFHGLFSQKAKWPPGVMARRM